MAEIMSGDGRDEGGYPHRSSLLHSRSVSVYQLMAFDTFDHIILG